MWQKVLGHVDGNTLENVRRKHRRQARAGKHDPILLAAAWEAAQKHYGQHTSGRAGLKLAVKRTLQGNEALRALAGSLVQAMYVADAVNKTQGTKQDQRDAWIAVAARLPKSYWRYDGSQAITAVYLDDALGRLVITVSDREYPWPKPPPGQRQAARMTVPPARLTKYVYVDAVIQGARFEVAELAPVPGEDDWNNNQLGPSWVVRMRGPYPGDPPSLAKVARIVWSATQGLETYSESGSFDRHAGPYTFHTPRRTRADKNTAATTIQSAWRGTRARREYAQRLNEHYRPGGRGYEEARDRFETQQRQNAGRKRKR